MKLHFNFEMQFEFLAARGAAGESVGDIGAAEGRNEILVLELNSN